VIRTVGAALVVALTVAPSLQAQAPESLIASGIRAYRNLDFDAAAGFFTRALTLLGATADTARRAEALTYLGATEVYRQRTEGALGLFRDLVRLSPAYRIDRLIFPPEVTGVFDAARRVTPAVAARLAREQRFRTGDGGLTGTLFGSVTSLDLAEALEKAGYQIDRRKIDLEDPIKQLGEFQVPVRLHREVTATVAVQVVAETEP